MTQTKPSASFWVWVNWLLAAGFALGDFLLIGLNGFNIQTEVWGFRGFQIYFGFVYLSFGNLILLYYPKNKIGILFNATGWSALMTGFLTEYTIYALVERAGAIPFGETAAWMTNWLWVPAVGFISIYVPLFFPTGEIVSPKWKKALWLGTAILLLTTGYFAFVHGVLRAVSNVENPLGVIKINGTDRWFLFFILLLLGGSIPGVMALFVRLRQAGFQQRQQIKWFLFGAITLPFGPLVGSLPGLLPKIFLALFVSVMPFSIAIAIIRYRLWDIDIIIRRTLQYALLTGLLALIYFGGVIILQEGASALTGQGDSPLVTVISTLIIAAMFNPLRRRVQDFIDRRFYRAKYDAEKALAQFATTARDEVDMEKLTAALLEVVDDTMQPSRISLWLIPGSFDQNQ